MNIPAFIIDKYEEDGRTPLENPRQIDVTLLHFGIHYRTLSNGPQAITVAIVKMPNGQVVHLDMEEYPLFIKE